MAAHFECRRFSYFLTDIYLDLVAPRFPPYVHPPDAVRLVNNQEFCWLST